MVGKLGVIVRIQHEQRELLLIALRAGSTCRARAVRLLAFNHCSSYTYLCISSPNHAAVVVHVDRPFLSSVFLVEVPQGLVTLLGKTALFWRQTTQIPSRIKTMWTTLAALDACRRGIN